MRTPEYEAPDIANLLPAALKENHCALSKKDEKIVRYMVKATTLTIPSLLWDGFINGRGEIIYNQVFNNEKIKNKQESFIKIARATVTGYLIRKFNFNLLATTKQEIQAEINSFLANIILYQKAQIQMKIIYPSHTMIHI